MKPEMRERIAVAFAAIPVAFILSIAMRVVANRCHVNTPGSLFVNWFVGGYRPEWITGPAWYYLIFVDLGSCWIFLVCLYWLIYKRFYDV
jgi:hypothetical protein